MTSGEEPSVKRLVHWPENKSKSIKLVIHTKKKKPSLSFSPGATCHIVRTRVSESWALLSYIL